MPVFQCSGCPDTEPCRLFILDENVAEPDKCPWGGENDPVWRKLGVTE